MTRDQVFWTILGGVLAVLLGVFVFWGGSLRSDLSEERAAWKRHVDELNQLRSLAQLKKIPSEQTLKDWGGFNLWLSKQNEDVAEFFKQRDNNLEQRLVEGSRSPSPGDFESAYNERYRNFRRIIEHKRARGLHVVEVDLVRRYPWMDSEDEPSPSEYAAVRRDLWVREYLVLRLLLRHGITELRRFAVMPREAIPIPDLKQTRFHAVPVRIQCVLPPDKVVGLLRDMLAVRPAEADKLFINLRELKLEKAAGLGAPPTPPVTMELLIDVIDFEPKS